MGELLAPDWLRAGRGGVWRIPPSFDGANRKPLPRFTVISNDDLHRLHEFFGEFGRCALHALVPGGHIFIASNPLLSSMTFYSLQEAGFEKRGEIIRLVLRAARFRESTGGAAGTVASMIDHTLLKPDATRMDIEKLCGEAAQFHFATVCVNPAWVALSSRLLRGSGVGVCSVVGFPLGATTADVKHYETRRAIFDGASEIDMVINIGALKSGDLKVVERDIAAVVGPCREANVASKVIIEVALLNDDEKIAACTLSKTVGADFVKTSTGFASGGATAADVALMRRVVGADMGVKAAGGVRDYEGLKAMVAAGATRVGASAGVKIVQESQGQKTTAQAPAGY